MPWIDRSPLEYQVNTTTSIRRWEDTRPPVSGLNGDYKQFRVGDLWLDTTATYWWILSYKDSTMGIWRQLAYVPGNLDFLTGDAGGAVGPDGLNNINILGGAGITTTGNPVTNTITVALTGGGGAVDNVITDDANNTTPDGAGNIYYLGDTAPYLNGVYFFGDPANNTISARDLRNITVYVVDPTALQTEYQTIQAALDAADAAGGGTVWIRPGTYTEDLVLYDGVDLVGAVAAPVPLGTTTIIIGQHTPPLAGAFSIRNIALADADSILERNGAGTTVIALIDCTFDVTNGTAINLPNWTGTIATLNCHSIGTIDSYANIGAGAANFLAMNCTMGIGGGLIVLGGVNRIDNCTISTAMTWIGSASGMISACRMSQTWLVDNDASAICCDTYFIAVKDTVFLNHTSTGYVTLANVTIDVLIAQGDVIIGTGIVVFSNVSFIQSYSVAATIIQQAREYQITGPMTIIPDDSTDAAKDAWIKYDIPATQGYSQGIDNSDSDSLKITDGASPSAGTLLWKMTSAGERTMLQQPYIMAYKSLIALNCTGAGANFDLVADFVEYEQGNNYNPATGIYTIPVTGVYQIILYYRFAGITAAMTFGDVGWLVNGAFTTHEYILSPGATRNSANEIQEAAYVITRLYAAGTTLQPRYIISNGAGNTVSAIAGSCGFSIMLMV